MPESAQTSRKNQPEDNSLQPTPHTVAILQARMSSKRLPGKVLRDIGGEPMLARVVERALRAQTIDQVVIATTDDPTDDRVAAMCQRRGYSFYRGDHHDVLDRFYQTARAFRAEVVVRLTGDCPLIDPGVIDHVVGAFFEAGVDFAANRLPPPWHRTYPIGLDTEVCTFKALEQAWTLADQPHQREHVLPYLYEEPNRFRILVVDHDPDYGHLRWTVDTAEDLELVRQIFSRFGNRNDFSWEEILALFSREPALADINAHIHHKSHGDSET